MHTVQLADPELARAGSHTEIQLSDEQYEVVQAYANLFCEGNLTRAVFELARRSQRREPRVSQNHRRFQKVKR